MDRSRIKGESRPIPVIKKLLSYNMSEKKILTKEILEHRLIPIEELSDAVANSLAKMNPQKLDLSEAAEEKVAKYR